MRRGILATAAILVVSLTATGCGQGAHGTAATGVVPTHTASPGSSPAASPASATVAASVPVRRLPAQLPRRTVRVPILMYHRIDRLTADLPAITRGLTVEPADFRRQMAWLHAHRYHAVTQAQLYAALMHGARLPAHPVMLTFDDGYRDVLRYAAPVLARLRYPATAYVITGRISGPDASFLTWGMLGRLERAGVEIGSHTVHHPALPTLTDTQALQELRASRRVLERHLGHPVQWFAYPAGAEDPRIVKLTRQAGYVLAVTTHPGVEQDARHPLELHRLEVLDTTGVGGLVALFRR